jgi:zinc protease
MLTLMNDIKNTLLLALLSLLPFGLFAQNKNAILPLDPAVRTGKLANGFTYYIRHNEEPRHRVLLYLVNKAGSVLEDEDQRGLAHFMEHMSFNGTKHFPHNDLVDYLQKAGVRFGADLNAYTSFDETVYQLPIPSDNPALLKGGIEIMRDWAQEATLDPTEIDKERGVVLEEKRLGKGAGERMQRQYWPMLLNNSRYAVRIPIGLDTVLDNFKRPAIYRFYHDWYRPDLQALIIVGDVNADSLVKVVKATFGDLKNPEHERPRTNYTVPLTGKNQFIAVTDKEMTATVAEVIIKHPQPALKTAVDYRYNIVRELFNQMLTERYAELSRKADVPFVQGGAEISGFLGGLDSYDANVVARPGELELGFKAVWRETERIKRFGFTATELERAKSAYLNSMETAMQEKNKTSSQSFVKEYQAYFLKGIVAPGIVLEYGLAKHDLPGITLNEVNNLTKTYITNINRDILIMAPEKDKSSLPDEATVNHWMKAVESEDLKPYQDNVSAKSLLAAQPVPGRIVTEQKDTSLHTLMLTLSNGLKVWLKPTAFKNDEILFNGFASGGTSLYSDADYQSAASAGNIIPAGGAGNYDPDQLDKYLEGRQLSVKPFINERFEGIRGSSTNKDLKTALQLIYAEFTEPREDSAIFKGMIAKSKAGLVNRANDPSSVFSDTISAVLGNYNVRRTGPTPAKLEQVNLDKAYTIYKERFADASGFTFVFTGSIDTNAIKPLLEKYLGSLPATYRHEQALDLHIHRPDGVIEKTVYKGTEPKATVLLDFSGKFDYSPQNVIKMDALKECLEIRLLQRLREDESGVYSPGVFASNNKLPQQRYGFFVQFGCAPQNVDKLIASTLDEISKLKTSGPPQENMDKWRAEEKTARGTALQTNSFWLNYTSAAIQDGDNPDEVNNYDALLDQVNAADVKEMAGRYLSGTNYIRLVLKPETNHTTE